MADAFDAFRNHPLFEGFEEDPVGQRANYFSNQGQFGASPNRRKFFEQQFQDVQNQFLGRIGTMFKTGTGDPQKEDWTGFLSDYFGEGGGADYDWMQQGANRQNANSYNPRVQFNYGSSRPGP